MASNVEVIFRGPDGKPSLWVRRYRGKQFVNTRAEAKEVSTNDDIISEIRRYLTSNVQPAFDAALYDLAKQKKLSEKYTHSPLFHLIGWPDKLQLKVFPDLSIHDGYDFYESINELCVELKYNPVYRKRLTKVEPVEAISPYSGVIAAMAEAVSKLKQVHIKLQ